MHVSLFPASLAELIRSRTLCFVLVALLVVPALATTGCDSDSDDDDDNGAVADPGEGEEEEEEGKTPKPEPKPKPKPNNARALASISTQVNCDISTFFLHITDVELKEQGGGHISLLDAPMRVDLARLDQRLKEQAIAITGVPSGVYTGARITFDLEQSLAVILNHEQMALDPSDPGNQEPATLVDPDGNPLVITPAEPGENERTVSIDVIGDSLTIEADQLGHLRLIANLAAGAIADADANELEWTPVFEAEFDPDPLHSMFAQGYLLNVSVINHRFTMGLATAFEDIGQITDVHVNQETVYQIAHGVFGVQPIAKRGVDGLSDLYEVPEGTPLLVDLRAFKNDNGLLADCVNAGLGVETSDDSFAYGLLLEDFEGTMHAFIAHTPEHGYRFNIQLEVEGDADYLPVLVECTHPVQTAGWLLFGQTVVLFGEISTKKSWKKKEERFESIFLSNKFCEEIEALARVLPSLYCGEHYKTDFHKEVFAIEVCTVGCLDYCYIERNNNLLVEEGSESCGLELLVYAPGVDLCKCLDKKDEKKEYEHEIEDGVLVKDYCLCFYGYRFPEELTVEFRLPVVGNVSFPIELEGLPVLGLALDLVCPKDELEVDYPRDRQCVTASLINDCEVWLNLLDCARALLHPCNTCEETVNLHKEWSHLILWAVHNGTKYFSIFDNDHVDQYLDPIDFTDSLYERIKIGDRNIYRVWASGEFVEMQASIVFFGNHIVVILQDKHVEQPTK